MTADYGVWIKHLRASEPVQVKFMMNCQANIWGGDPSEYVLTPNISATDGVSPLTRCGNPANILKRWLQATNPDAPYWDKKPGYYFQDQTLFPYPRQQPCYGVFGRYNAADNRVYADVRHEACFEMAPYGFDFMLLLPQGGYEFTVYYEANPIWPHSRNIKFFINDELQFSDPAPPMTPQFRSKTVSYSTFLTRYVKFTMLGIYDGFGGLDIVYDPTKGDKRQAINTGADGEILESLFSGGHAYLEMCSERQAKIGRILDLLL